MSCKDIEIYQRALKKVTAIHIRLDEGSSTGLSLQWVANIQPHQLILRGYGATILQQIEGTIWS